MLSMSEPQGSFSKNPHLCLGVDFGPITLLLEISLQPHFPAIVYMSSLMASQPVRPSNKTGAVTVSYTHLTLPTILRV